MSATRDLSLLNPEWHGCGDAEIHRGATMLAEALFPADAFVRVDVPAAATLQTRAGVLALDDIARRAAHTLADLRHRAPDRLFHVGGTCGTELAPIACMNDRYAGDLAVVWLDAHADLNTPASSPSGRFHGMVLRTLTGSGPAELVSLLARPLLPGQLFLAGARDLDPPEQAFVHEARVSLTTVAELDTPEILRDRLRASGFGRAYVHLDLDVLDPASFPDALVRTPVGAAPAQVAAQIRALVAAVEVVGFSVVEFVPRTETGVRAVGDLLEATGVSIGAMRTLRRDY
jgi:arginase